MKSNNLSSVTQYYPKIDSLRACAVLLVLFHHYFNEKITHLLSLGNLGVDIFFTISGFLITGILFSYKEKFGLSQSLRVFYIRRILRIFPIYYLYIGVVVLFFGAQISQNHLIWTSLFCENFYIISGGKSNEVFTHFWSLAVEEQFYIIWPILMLVVSNKYAKHLIIVFIFSSFIFSVLNTLIFKIPYVEYMHPLSCFLGLALGALVKYFSLYESDKLYFFARNSMNFSLLSLSLWVGVLIVFDFNHPSCFVLLRLFASLFTAFFLIRITDNSKNLFIDRVFNNRILIYIGKISYGIYVYHMIVKIFLDPIVWKVINRMAGEHNLIRYNVYIVTLPLNTLVTILLAGISFKYFETNISKLKNRLANYN